MGFPVFQRQAEYDGIIRLSCGIDQTAGDYFSAEEDNHSAKQNNDGTQNPADHLEDDRLPPGEDIEPDIQGKQQKNRAEDELIHEYCPITRLQNDATDSGRHNKRNIDNKKNNKYEQDTMSADGELVISILASYAQEESLSVSENQKWRIKKNFEEGKPWNNNMFGYRQDNGVLVIVPEEAAVVRRVFDLYLSGMGVVTITKRLRAEGFGWSKTCIEKMLKNYTYTGNLLLQRRFRSDHISKKSIKNVGQKPMYHAADTHEAIIPLSVFEAVQDEMHRRSEHYKGEADKPQAYPLTGKIMCVHCGKHYRRKKARDRVVWQCLTYNVYGKEACPCGKAIPEPVLEYLTADIALDDLTAIRAENGNRLVFCFKDGSESVKRWQDRSRAESWTPEMKEAARQKTLDRHKRKAEPTI